MLEEFLNKINEKKISIENDPNPTQNDLDFINGFVPLFKNPEVIPVVPKSIIIATLYILGYSEEDSPDLCVVLDEAYDKLIEDCRQKYTLVDPEETGDVSPSP